MTPVNIDSPRHTSVSEQSSPPSSVQSTSEHRGFRKRLKESLVKPLLDPCFSLYMHKSNDTYSPKPRIFSASTVLKAKQRSLSTPSHLMGNPKVTAVQENNPILNTDWFRCDESEKSTKIVDLMEACLELYQNNMDSETQALFASGGIFRTYLLENQNESSLNALLTQFCQFVALMVLVEAPNVRKDLFGLFPPSNREDYQCVPGTGERLQNMGMKSLVQSLGGVEESSSLLLEMDQQLGNSFDQYIQKSILKPGVLDEVPEGYQVHLISCLSYILGLEKSIAAQDIFYQTPLTMLSSKSVYDILQRFEVEVDGHSGDFKKAFDDSVEDLSQKIEDWESSGFRGDKGSLVEEHVMIKAVSSFREDFSLSEFKEMNEECTEFWLNRSGLNSSIQRAFQEFASDHVHTGLDLVDGFSDVPKVCSYFMSEDKSQLNGAINLLYAMSERFEQASPIAFIHIMNCLQELNPEQQLSDIFLQVGERAKGLGIAYQLEKLERIETRHELFVTRPQEGEDGGVLVTGVLQYMNKVTGAEDVLSTPALLHELLHNGAPLSEFEKYIPSNFSPAQKLKLYPNNMYEHPQLSDILDYCKDFVEVETSRLPLFISGALRKDDGEALAAFVTHDLLSISQLDGVAYRAVSAGKANILRSLHALGVDIFHISSHGDSAAHLAAQKGFSEVLQVLADTGHDLNTINQRGYTPAFIATCEKRESCLRTLKQNGVDFDQCDFKGKSLVFYAANSGLTSIVKFFGAETQVDLNRPSTEGVTPAEAALRFGHGEVVRLLADHGVDLGAIRSSDGGTLAHVAVIRGKKEMLPLLADYNVPLNTMDSYDYTPLLYTIREGNEAAMQSLLDLGVNLKREVATNKSLLSIAGHAGHPFMVRHIMSASQANGDQLADGAVMIEAAARNRAVSAMKELMSLRVPLEGVDGDHLFQVATKEGNIQLMEALLLVKSKVNVCDDAGNNLLHLAAQHNSSNMVSRLIANGVSHHEVNTSGITPLEIAVEKVRDGTANGEFLRVLDRSLQPNSSLPSMQAGTLNAAFLEEFRQSGISLNFTNWQGQTPLSIGLSQLRSAQSPERAKAADSFVAKLVTLGVNPKADVELHKIRKDLKSFATLVSKKPEQTADRLLAALTHQKRFNVLRSAIEHKPDIIMSLLYTLDTRSERNMLGMNVSVPLNEEVREAVESFILSQINSLQQTLRES